ncbi:SGNH/GDSL hydrolase family protein [Cohnella fermenti]|uniref:SGNH/GDSL hydrolase family protein n=1 Tax=Cohnella fermenti TaxID=2565925 RepID=UPI001E3A0EA4|nr:SGNH/GDSL hydrolase family protein [Cohnella fermenti]
MNLDALKAERGNKEPEEGKGAAIQWHDPRKPPFQIVGFPWFDREGLYRRLPKDPAYPVREPVDTLANCTAGGQVRFRTNSPVLRLSVKLTGSAEKYHMAATAQCGFDCYIGGPGKAKYASTTRFDASATQYEAVLYEDLEEETRDVTIHFPLYQGVEEVRIGVAEGAELAVPNPFASEGKLLFYGTSITQGGCASRPGMAYPSIVGRRLNRECINLGFSGNGKGEPELARLICEIESPDLLVLNYVPNVNPDEYRETLPAFVDIVRAARPRLPILVVSGIRYAMEGLRPSLLRNRTECRNFARAFVAGRRTAGDSAISFVNGDTLLGREYEDCTVDGVHPTDLGFRRIGDRLAKEIDGMLKGLSR